MGTGLHYDVRKWIWDEQDLMGCDKNDDLRYVIERSSMQRHVSKTELHYTPTSQTKRMI